MPFSTATSPHIALDNSVGRVMRRVLYATLPAVAVLTWLFGWGTLLQIALASVAALTAETLLLLLRARPLRPFLLDGSALVTAWLLALALPAYAPWWLTVVGVVFALVFAKHLYGGLGYNPFNPAMIGYVTLLISFPLEMTTWPTPVGLNAAPHLSDALHLIFAGQTWPDGLTGATALDTVKIQLSLGQPLSAIPAASLFTHGPGFEWVSLAFLFGGLWLVYNRTAAWQIPAGMLGALLLISTLFYLLDPQTHASPWFHLFSGATMFGAFFIATDPVSASTTPRGRLIFGAGIGILVYVIRTLGGYPDGVAFAVLLMNIAAPTIDYYTQPKVFGARS